MISSIWALYDVKAHIYHEPKLFRNDEIAQIYIRRDIDRQLEQDGITHEMLGDFRFVKLGTFDDEYGKIYPEDIDQRMMIRLDRSDDV